METDEKKMADGIDKAIVAFIGNNQSSLKRIEYVTGKLLDEKPPINTKLETTISGPTEWLSKRIYNKLRETAENFDAPNYVSQHSAYVIANREEGTIELVWNETDPYQSGRILGSIIVAQSFLAWGINNPAKSWTPNELAEHIRMNRTAFASIEAATSLFKVLKDFKAKIEKIVSQQQDDRANYEIRKSQAVETNLPAQFTLTMAVIKGMPIMTFAVEIIIRSDSFACFLVSPDANDLVTQMRERAIDTELSLINEIAPGIPILEK